MITPRATPLIIADRGASADAPEHTIAAFELALDQGADGIALDVHLTRDGQPVVIHDFTLERTTDGAGTVAAHTMREMKRLDAGAWRSRRFQGQRVQTLQEVLERFRGRTRVWIEIRGGSDLYPDIEERVVSVIEIYEAVDQTLIQSMDLESLTRIRTLNRDITLGAIVLGSSLEPFLVGTSPAQALSLLPERLTETAESEIRKVGLACYVRAGDDLGSLERLSVWDVDGIITARPSLVRTKLGR
jgi:glycerophosphoryl diester phosphodiesterase